MKVSILVPVYGVENFIERCAISLFEQSYENIEYIFVNDCSKDLSLSVLESVINKYPERKSNVVIINHKINKGLAAARNTAVNAATGDYIMHVDSDDYIDLKTVEECVFKIKETNADVVVYGMNIVYKDKKIIELPLVPSNNKEYICKILRRECSACVCGGMYRRSIYVANNINAIEGINMGEDYMTKPRLIYYAQIIATIDKPLYNYVQYNIGSYTKTFDDSTIENLYQIPNSLTAFFKEKQDYNEFKDSLSYSYLLQKVIVLKYWAQSNASSLYVDKINKLFRNEYDSLDLKKSHALILLLAKLKWTSLLRLYIRIGIKINKLKKYV